VLELSLSLSLRLFVKLGPEIYVRYSRRFAITEVNFMKLSETGHFVFADFGSDECLQEELMSSEFTTCHQNFSATYSTKAKRQSCK